MGGGFRAAVARRYASSIRMDGDSGPQAEVMKGHGEAEAQESCGSLSGVRVVLVTTGSRGDAAVRVLPSRCQAAAMARGGGSDACAQALPGNLCRKQGAQFKWKGQKELSFGSKNVVCCGSSSLNFTVVAAHTGMSWGGPHCESLILHLCII